MNRLRRAWTLLNLPCEGIARLESDSLERDLGRAEGIALKSHRVYCMACRRYSKQTARIREALRGLSARIDDDLIPGPSLPEDARVRIKDSLSGR